MQTTNFPLTWSCFNNIDYVIYIIYAVAILLRLSILLNILPSRPRPVFTLDVPMRLLSILLFCPCPSPGFTLDVYVPCPGLCPDFTNHYL